PCAPSRPEPSSPAPRAGRGWREVADDDRPRSRGRWRDEEDRQAGPTKSSRKARWALFLGVLSPFLCVLGPITALAAVVLGAMGRRDVARSQGELGGASAALAGLVMGLIGLVISGLTTLVAWPSLQSFGEGAARKQNRTDLQQLAQAMLRYEANHGHFPEAAIYSD